MIEETFDEDGESGERCASDAHHLRPATVSQDASGEATGVDAVVHIVFRPMLLDDTFGSRVEHAHRGEALGIGDALDAGIAYGFEKDVSGATRFEGRVMTHGSCCPFHTRSEEAEDEAQSSTSDASEGGSDKTVVEQILLGNLFWTWHHEWLLLLAAIFRRHDRRTRNNGDEDLREECSEGMRREATGEAF